jgi:hypothetical protein
LSLVGPFRRARVALISGLVLAAALSAGGLIATNWQPYLRTREACDGYARTNGFELVGHAKGFTQPDIVVLDLRRVSQQTTLAGLSLCLHDVAAAYSKSNPPRQVILSREGRARVEIEGHAFWDAGFATMASPWTFWESLASGATSATSGSPYGFDVERNTEAARRGWLTSSISASIDGWSQNMDRGDAILHDWSGLPPQPKIQEAPW